MPPEPCADDRTAAAVAAWRADRGDRIPPDAARVAATDESAVAVLARHGVGAVPDDGLAAARAATLAAHPAHAGTGPHALAVALPGDVAAAESLEAFVAGMATRVRAGGLAVVAAPGCFTPAGGVSALALARALGHAGLTVVDQFAPGAAARIGGAAHDSLAADRTPGLLDAGPVTVAVGRRWREEHERDHAFWASLPRKVVAAAVLCRDAHGRLLCVHDAFKQRWTIPGGVVDADESPDDAARREAAEEAGADVALGALLGVFGAPWPDRLTFVYAATARGEVAGPRRAHEIDAVEWVPLEEARERLVGYVAEQVARSLDAPGGTWRQDVS